MGTVYEELDEAKAEIEKLRSDYRIKLEFSEGLKRAHNEQLIKFHEANLKIDNLSQQLNEKVEEISVANQMYEELKSKLKEKEAFIKHLTCANDKLRADCKEKIRSFEEDNRGITLALDEANAKNMDQEQLIHSWKLEVEGLKGIVSVSQNKCSEVNRKHKAFQDVRRGEDVLLKLEEEKSKYENQLKWKKEQFAHLEEAHKKLRHEFQVNEKEWERDRASLLDEISRLESKLYSQTRISESLQSRLQMCNQALAHEESKRKYLEAQLSESKTNFDNVFAEYEEAKSTIESLTGHRDKEIACLRNSLGTRESIYKEMEYQVRMLEQEKQDLMVSLKELQEAQIQEGGGSTSSLTKLRNKLRGLELVHKGCSARLKAKETDWKFQLEVLMEKLNGCSSELDNKNTLTDQLKMEAEAHDSMVVQLALHNEEDALMVLVLKSGIWEAQLKLADAYVDLDQKKKERKESLSLFRGLQEVHRECSTGLKTKEAEWNSQMEFLEEKLKCCCSELESKNILIDQLKMEAEAHDSMVVQLALHNEEDALMVLVLKSGFWEAQLKLADAYVNLVQKKKERNESLSLFRCLQEVHRECSVGLKTKEAEWNSQMEFLEEKLKCCCSELESKNILNSQMEFLEEKLKCCCSELESKNILIDQLKIEAEAHDSMVVQLALHNEEDALMVLVLKSGLWKAQLKLADAYVDLDQKKKERNESLSLFSGLQEMHKECSAGLKTKEAEWNSQMEFLEVKLKCCGPELESKNILIDQLKMEAEVHDSMIEQLALLNQEASFILLVLKSGFQEAYTKLAESYAALDEKNKQSKEREAHLLVQLEMENSTLAKAQSDTEEECKKVANLSEKVESVTFIEKQQLFQHKELERLEKLLSESYTCQCELKKQVLSMNSELKEVCSALHIANEELDEKICQGMEFEFQLQIWIYFAKELKTNFEKDHQMQGEVEATLHAQLLSLKSDLKKVRKTLARANEELADKFCQGNEGEFELQIWKSIAEQLKANLEEYHQMRREVEASLLAEVTIEVNIRQEKEGLLNLLEEKDKRIEDLHGEITLLNQELETREKRDAIPVCTKNEKFYSSRISVQSADRNLDDDYQEEEEWVKRELECTILAQVDAEKNYEHEKESLHHLVEERDQRIEHLQQLVKSLEQEIESSISTFSSRLSEMQMEINLFHESWHKLAIALFLKEMEIQEKNMIIVELENDLTDIESGSQASKSEVQRLRGELEKERSTSDLLIQKLNDEKGKVIEDVLKLSSDRENLLDTLGQLSDRMHKLSMDDQRLMGELDKEQSTSDLLIQKLNVEKGKIIEDVVKLSLDSENLLDTLGGLSDRMNKLSMDDLQLMESLRNILHNFDSSELEMDFKGEDEYFDPVKENKNLYASPRTTKAEAILDERFPLRAINNGLLRL